MLGNSNDLTDSTFRAKTPTGPIMNRELVNQIYDRVNMISKYIVHNIKVI